MMKQTKPNLEKGYDSIFIYGNLPKHSQMMHDEDESDESIRSMNSDDIGIEKLTF
jgi:hypothetical protein